MSDRADGALGRDERRVRGPVQRKGFGLAPTGWVDPRGRTLGAWAFAANRITGLGLVFYLYLHLGVLTTLLWGAHAWGRFLGVATNIAFLGLDVVLLFGLLYHGLNGVRVMLVGTGFVTDRQRALWWAGAAIGTIVLLGGASHFLGGR